MGRDRSGNGSDAIFDAVLWCLGAMIVAMFVWTVWRAWDDATSPAYTLRKDQWVCSANRSYYTVAVGKFHNHLSRRTVCSQYSHTG